MRALLQPGTQWWRPAACSARTCTAGKPGITSSLLQECYGPDALVRSTALTDLLMSWHASPRSVTLP